MNKNLYIIIGSILALGVIWYLFFSEETGFLGKKDRGFNFTWTESPFEQFDLGTLNTGTGDDIITGCMLEDALNYDPNATVENGTCVFEMGCCDVNASNYDPTANSCFIEGNDAAQCDYNGDGGYPVPLLSWWPNINDDQNDAHAFATQKMIGTNQLDFLLQKCAERDDCELKQMTKKGANSNLANFKHCQNPYGCLWATKPNSTKLIKGWDDNDNPEYLALTQCGSIAGFTEWRGCDYGGNPPYEYINSPFAEQIEDVQHGGDYLNPKLMYYSQYLNRIDDWHESYNS